MGAWGIGTFDNDTACDWASDLASTTDLSLVLATLSSVTEAGDAYVNADAACEALAACEVVARLKGNWGVRDAYTETLDGWVRDHAMAPSRELVVQALAAIDRVGRAPSELLELWEDSEESVAWQDGVQDLRRRVAG